MSKRLILIIAVAVIFLSSAGIVTFLSAQEGNDPRAKSPAALQAALPLETRFAPDQIYRAGPPAAPGGISAAAPGGILAAGPLPAAAPRTPGNLTAYPGQQGSRKNKKHKKRHH